MIIEPSSRDNINGQTSSSSSLSPTTTRFQQQQYYHHYPVRRCRDDREVEQQQYESQPRSRRRINKERVEQDMNLVYTCSRKISDTLTTHTKHDELPHIDALIDTTKRMLHTLDDAKEQWLEKKQRFSNINTTHNNSKTIISSSTSANFSSTITNTTANLDRYHLQQQHQTILSSSPSSPSPTSKTLSSQQLQRQQLPKRAREHSTNTTKQCHSCQSTETPEWRKGPMGPRTLCNACGLIWAKLARQQGISEEPDEEMTATIVTTSPSSTTSSRNTSSTENNEGNKCALSYLLS